MILTFEKSAITMSGMRVLKTTTFQIVIFSILVTVIEASPFIYGCSTKPFVTTTHTSTTMIRFKGFFTNNFIHWLRFLFAFVARVTVGTYCTHTRSVLRCSLTTPSLISNIIRKTLYTRGFTNTYLLHLSGWTRRNWLNERPSRTVSVPVATRVK